MSENFQCEHVCVHISQLRKILHSHPALGEADISQWPQAEQNQEHGSLNKELGDQAGGQNKQIQEAKVQRALSGRRQWLSQERACSYRTPKN